MKWLIFIGMCSSVVLVNTAFDDSAELPLVIINQGGQDSTGFDQDAARH